MLFLQDGGQDSRCVGDAHRPSFRSRNHRVRTGAGGMRVGPASVAASEPDYLGPVRVRTRHPHRELQCIGARIPEGHQVCVGDNFLKFSGQLDLQ